MTFQLSLLFLHQNFFERQINEGGFYFSSHLTKPLHIFTSDITDNINHLSDFNRERKKRREEEKKKRRKKKRRERRERKEEKRKRIY